MPHRLRRYVFVSQLPSPAYLPRVAEIFQQVRAITKDTGVTGILVFDGAYFCHYLEGPASALSTLVARIAIDDRHIHMTTLVDDVLPGRRLFKAWGTAYTTHDEVDALLAFKYLRGQAVVDRFLELVPSLDGVYG